MTIMEYIKINAVGTLLKQNNEGYNDRLIVLKDGSEISVDLGTFREITKYINENN